MIFLKRIELQGFKSFAGKTILEFPAQVTAIVGPNGSGKSNIIDALRWALGERGVKELRGETWSNLIFAGTPKKAAAGLAKVGLCFNNKDKLFPFDVSEVMLVRKVDRSGISQFFLNDAEMRLKDLAPMLARAKLGSRGLTVVRQGDSDIFVRSRPEERRLMIEEILGLREFRLKKEQAERRLALSKINMDRVKAMLQELAPHLRLLRRQRKRWDRRNEIEKDLRDLEDKYFSARYHEIDQALHAIEAPIGRLTEEKKKKEADILNLEKTLREIDKSAVDVNRTKELRMKIASLIDERSLLNKELARLEARLELEEARDQEFLPSTAELSQLLKALSHDIAVWLNWDDLGRLKTALNEWLVRLQELFRDRPAADAKTSRAEEERLKAIRNSASKLKFLRIRKMI